MSNINFQKGRHSELDIKISILNNLENFTWEPETSSG